MKRCNLSYETLLRAYCGTQEAFVQKKAKTPTQAAKQIFEFIAFLKVIQEKDLRLDLIKAGEEIYATLDENGLEELQ